MATTKAINDSIRILAANGLQGGPTTQERITLVAETWAAVLADLTDADLKAAVMAHLRDPERCQFWPQPGTLIALSPSQSERMSADEAWGWCVELAGSRGQYAVGQAMADVEQQDEAVQITAALKAIGGIGLLAITDYSEHGHMRASFRGAYNSAKGRERAAASHQLTDGEARKLLAVVRPKGRS